MSLFENIFGRPNPAIGNLGKEIDKSYNQAKREINKNTNELKKQIDKKYENTKKSI